MATPPVEIPEKLPSKTNENLTKSQIIIERSSIERAEKRARSLLFANIALLTSLTATQSFIDPPYLLRGLLWAALGLCVISSVFCGLTIHETDRRLNNLDLTGKKQDRKIINVSDEFSFWGFGLTFILLSAFISVNIFESLRTDRIVFDITASNYVVDLGEVVSLAVDDEMGEEFIWAASAGELLDNDERTVTWIAPSSLSEDVLVVDIKVCVRRNHVFFCETDKILVKNASENNDAAFSRFPLSSLASTHISFQADAEHSCPTNDTRTSWLKASLLSNDPFIPGPAEPLIPGLPCCSTLKLKINCDWNC